MKDRDGASKEKDEVMLQLAEARSYAACPDGRGSAGDDLHEAKEVMEDESDA